MNSLSLGLLYNFGGFTDSPHPHKQETRGLYTIQATSFFPWWQLLLFQENFEAKEHFYKILKSGKILRNRRPAKMNVNFNKKQSIAFTDHMAHVSTNSQKWKENWQSNARVGSC